MVTDIYKGVLSFWNMKEYCSDKTPEETTEYPLYTDAHITGELTKGCEPYSFINMLSMKQEPGVVSESILLRIGWYISGNPKCEIKTDTSKYHGRYCHREHLGGRCCFSALTVLSSLYAKTTPH